MGLSIIYISDLQSFFVKLINLAECEIIGGKGGPNYNSRPVKCTQEEYIQ